MDALGIDPKLLIAQIVNFAIFFVIFKKFIAKPLTNYIAKKKQDEESIALKKADIDQAHEEIEKMRQSAMAKVKEDQKLLLKEAKESVATIRKQMLEEATQEATNIVEESKRAMASESEKLQASVAKQVKQLAQVAVAQGLEKFLTQEQRESATEYIIKNLKS